MIKVLHCVETIGSGGVEQRRLLLAKYLDRSRFQQSLVCSHVKAAFDQKLISQGMSVDKIGSLRHVLDLSYYRKLFKLIRQIKPDIIHGAVFEGVISAVVGGLWCRVPVIIIEETSDPVNRSARATWLLKFLSYFAKFVVAISPSVADYLTVTAKVDKRKVRLIMNAVDEPNAPSEDEIELVRKTLDLDHSDFVIGSVGRLRDYHKRFSDLIKALPSMLDAEPNVKLLIVGDGEDRGKLEELSTTLKVQQSVIFAGFQKNTYPFYACMDVFALVSHMEGFGLVLLEAMNFKLPVVATRVGGIKDIVVDKVTGFLVSRDSPNEISSALTTLCKDEKLRRSMGDEGYRRARTEFDSSKYVENVQLMYEQSRANK
ncbi:MAG: glycosyltransferase [Cyclobacteriaceae bacterium]